MKKVFVFLFSLFLLFPVVTSADVWVNGYYRSNGTYVNGHYRSSPDGNPYNNYSFPGNTNPYTGKTAPGNANTYLNNYYNSNTYTPTYTPTYTNSCPFNSYSSGSTCTCNYGYVAKNGSCVSGNSLCMDQLGLMSTYNSLNKTCECMSGYVIGASGQCTYKSLFNNSYSNNYTPPVQESTCPNHSNPSKTDPDKCTCDTGYQVNKGKDKCVKISSKTNDKACATDFGTKSKWDGTYSSEGTPYCVCKDGFEWNISRTKCKAVAQ